MAKRQQDDQPIESAKEAVRAAGEAAATKAQTLFETNRSTLVSNAQAAARALRSASEQWQGGQQDGLGRFARRAADKIESTVRNLENRDVTETLHAVEDYARHRPAVMLGGAFALGLAAARFLRSSGTRRGFDGSSGRRSYPESMSGGRYGGVSVPIESH